MEISRKKHKSLISFCVFCAFCGYSLSAQTAYSLGEFAFRLDAGPAKFHLTVEAPGFSRQEQDIEISGDERSDVSIVLKK